MEEDPSADFVRWIYLHGGRHILLPRGGGRDPNEDTLPVSEVWTKTTNGIDFCNISYTQWRTGLTFEYKIKKTPRAATAPSDQSPSPSRLSGAMFFVKATTRIDPENLLD